MIRGMWRTISTVMENLTSMPYFGLRATAITFLTLLGSVINIASPFILTKIFIPEQVSAIGLERLLIVMSAYGGAWTLGRVIPAISGRLVAPMSSYISKQLVDKINNQFFKLSMDYQLSTPIGRMPSHITRAYYTINPLILGFVKGIVPTFFEATAITAILTFFYGPIIGSSAILLLIVYGGSTFLEAQWIGRAHQRQFDRTSQYYGQAMTAFNNFENVHYFNNISHELEINNQYTSEIANLTNQTLNRTTSSSIIQAFIIGIGFSGVMLYTTFQLSRGITSGFTIADLLMVSFYMIQMGLPLESFFNTVKDMKIAAMDLDSLKDFLETKRDIIENKNAKKLSVNYKNARIAFEDVSFAYKNQYTQQDVPVLNNISFAVDPGQKVAIVGLSGAGKSTILKLLMRFYDVTDGKITINNRDIREVTLSSLRQAIAVVPQATVLNNKTIEENVKYGNLKASVEKVNEAIRRAGLSDLVKQQSQIPAGELGNRLSGGQKQRVAIARAILKEGAIFFLDEPTAALDVKTEREVQTNLDETTENYATIVVTHRLPTIINADKIIYLEQGTIAEQGTYEELMKFNGKFCKQMKDYCESLGIPIELIQIKTRQTVTSTKNETEKKEEHFNPTEKTEEIIDLQINEQQPIYQKEYKKTKDQRFFNHKGINTSEQDESEEEDEESGLITKKEQEEKQSCNLQ